MFEYNFLNPEWIFTLNLLKEKHSEHEIYERLAIEHELKQHELEAFFEYHKNYAQTDE